VLDGGAGVLDHNTGLVWLKQGTWSAEKNWWNTVSYCTSLYVGGVTGWRLPTKDELLSLVDKSVAGSPKLPAGHPFLNVAALYYWSSTADYSDPYNLSRAWQSIWGVVPLKLLIWPT